MLWEIEISPLSDAHDVECPRVRSEYALLAGRPLPDGTAIVSSSRGFLLEGALEPEDAERFMTELLLDPLVEKAAAHAMTRAPEHSPSQERWTVLLKPGVMDPVAQSVLDAAQELGLSLGSVRTFRRYVFALDAAASCAAVLRNILANDAIEQIVVGPLKLEHLTLGSTYEFRIDTRPLATLDDAGLMKLSRDGQLSLSLPEMHAIQAYFRAAGRDPTDVELETLAQTWSEHCSHKTLKGRIDFDGRRIDNLLKETIFGATQEIRKQLGADDWCVSVFEDNAGVVRFDEHYNVCFKVETHNHPSAIEPYGGANTGLGGVIRDVLGTGLGAKPVCNTDVFCFAPPDTSPDHLPPGVLHPRLVMQGVAAGVRDYGNRMGIPTVNGAICFDARYLGNPLVFCGTVGLLPIDKSAKRVHAGDLIVAIGGRTGRDGVHGATFSSLELTSESETISGGAVQIGNAITEKQVHDVLLQARDLNLYHAITDCGAGGFSSAVGEMGEGLGATVQLDRAPLKYDGLSYTEIWISEAQERMVLAVPPDCWERLQSLCASEGVEATTLGIFEPTGRLRLSYAGQQVADLDMHFLHNGRPPVVRKASCPSPPSPGASTRTPDALVKRGYAIQDDLVSAIGEHSGMQSVSLTDRTIPQSIIEMVPESVARENIVIPLSHENNVLRMVVHNPGDYETIQKLQFILNKDIQPVLAAKEQIVEAINRHYGQTATESVDSMLSEGAKQDFNAVLLQLLASWNVCSKEWVIRQYDHEVQGGSVIKPLVGSANDGPGDAAVIAPVLGSWKGLAVGCGINPRYGDLDPYRMAALAIDEAVRNVVAVGADPSRIALLDNFCWGNTDRPEVLGSLVRAADACRDVALAYRMPFISGKDSLNNEFHAQDRHIVIPPTLLISALGIVPDVRRCVSMDLKEPGNVLLLVGISRDELGGSHYRLVSGGDGGEVPTVDLALAAQLFAKVHEAIRRRLLRSCHDLSEGGLAVALAEMAFAGGIGADVTQLPTEVSEEALLFAESAPRFVLEAAPANSAAIEELFTGLPIQRIGQTVKEPRVRIAGSGGEWIIWLTLDKLKQAWQKPLAW